MKVVVPSSIAAKYKSWWGLSRKQCWLVRERFYWLSDERLDGPFFSVSNDRKPVKVFSSQLLSKYMLQSFLFHDYTVRNHLYLSLIFLTKIISKYILF